MFRRLQSGLPKEPKFAQDLKGLGYFINEKDEIRSITNPKVYFNYFITKNMRYNDLQREGMNEAIRTIVAQRLEDLGLSKLRLPIDATETDKHVNIFISDDLKEKKDIIVLFYETCQDLGIFAHRVIGGHGGINAGSAVGFVKNIRESAAKAGKEAPGFVLANMGQQRWSTRLRRAVTADSWEALPRKSAADPGYVFDEIKNTIPGNENATEHVSYIFSKVLGNPDFCDQESQIQVLGVSDGARETIKFLHNPENFSRWCKGIESIVVYDWSTSPAEKIDGGFTKETYTNGNGAKKGNPRVVCLAAVATAANPAIDPEHSLPHYEELTNPDFIAWYAQKGRAYTLTHEPAGTFLAPPEGHKIYQALGAPAFSLGESTYTERMLIVGQDVILDWFAEVAADPHYANEQLVCLDYGSDDEVVYGDGALWKAEDERLYPHLFNPDGKPVDGEITADGLPEVPVALSYLKPKSDEEKAAIDKLVALGLMNDGGSGKTTSLSQVTEVPAPAADYEPAIWSEIIEFDSDKREPLVESEDEDFEAGMTLENVVDGPVTKESSDERDWEAPPAEKVVEKKSPKEKALGEEDLEEETISYGGAVDGYKYDPEVGAYDN